MVRSISDIRLRKDGQIRQVLNAGAALRGRFLFLRRLPAAKIKPEIQGAGPFFAAVISRKREKRAVLRNRMKRQLREIFKKHRDKLDCGAAYVFIARQCAKKISYQDLERDFLEMVGEQG